MHIVSGASRNSAHMMRNGMMIKCEISERRLGHCVTFPHCALVSSFLLYKLYLSTQLKQLNEWCMLHLSHVQQWCASLTREEGKSLLLLSVHKTNIYRWPVSLLLCRAFCHQIRQFTPEPSKSRREHRQRGRERARAWKVWRERTKVIFTCYPWVKGRNVRAPEQVAEDSLMACTGGTVIHMAPVWR